MKPTIALDAHALTGLCVLVYLALPALIFAHIVINRYDFLDSLVIQVILLKLIVRIVVSQLLIHFLKGGRNNMRDNNPFQIGTIYEVAYNDKIYDIPEVQYFKLEEYWREIDMILTKYERRD
jgi:hypothetical protein